MDAVPFEVGRVDGGFRFVGELDLTQVEVARTVLEPAVADGVAVVVDLSDLTFCDSSCIRLLVLLRDRAKESGVPFRLVRARPNVRKIFSVAGLEDMLEAD
jgi:anti-sigma B factor antagonist